MVRSRRQAKRIEAFEMHQMAFREGIAYLKEHYSSYVPIWDYYASLISKNIGSGVVFLDAGCGWRNNTVEGYLTEDIIAVGVDIDFEALKDNSTYKNLCCSTLENLPFKNNTFDMITTKCVLEHIEHPEVVFSEFSRVLKRRGRLIMVLPNLYNPAMLVGKLTPLWLHKKLMGAISKRYEEDIYSTYFRCNSVWSLDRMCKCAGFVKEELILKGDFALFISSKLLFHLWIVFDKITNNWFLKFTKMDICVCYRKVEVNQRINIKCANK